MSVVHIYRIPQVVALTTATGGSLMNYPVNRTDFRLARFVDNEVEFWVKNVDRRPVALTGATVTLHITDAKNTRPILSRDLTVLDAAKGLMRLFVSAEEAGSLPKEFLRYSIVLTRPDGVQTLLCTDRERRGNGTVEITDGPLPEPREPLPLSLGDFLSRGGKLYSGALPGAASAHNISGQHSVLVHLNEFVGTFTVQGTLNAQPDTNDAGWFDVVTETFDVPAVAKVHVPFEGNLMHVRFVVLQEDGNIDLILYRN